MGNIFNKRILIPNIKILIVPLTILLSSVGLLAVVISNYYPKVKTMFLNYDEAKRRNSTLEERVRILREFQIDAKNLMDITAIALPIDNPGTLILSNIKEVANVYNIEITNVSFTKGDVSGKKDKWLKMSLKLETQNENITSYLNFISDLNKVMPLVTVDNVNLKYGDNVVESMGNLSIYWSLPPETIPSLNSPIQNLSEKENKTLSLVQSLKVFGVTRLQPGGVNENRTSPFN